MELSDVSTDPDSIRKIIYVDTNTVGRAQATTNDDSSKSKLFVASE